MVGGQVIETIVLQDKVWINCKEKVNGRLIGDGTAIYVERNPKSCSVSEGDTVWWQGNRAMWTAKDANGNIIGKPDTVLKRIGFSGVNRPEVKNG